MSRANILNVREYCDRMCSETAADSDWKWGDVRRCPHGRIWYLGLQSIFWTEERWDHLSPWLNPFAYRRAVRAIAATEEA